MLHTGNIDIISSLRWYSLIFLILKILNIFNFLLFFPPEYFGYLSYGIYFIASFIKFNLHSKQRSRIMLLSYLHFSVRYGDF